MESINPTRCAIYTRKSTDEGLEKEFNTLEAQREAGENYIRSMKHQGWVALPEHYDDGGYSGGNLKRPALKQLLADVEAGKVDMIVVYKIDRLTRSLLDFAQLVQTFEKHHCSFVSVTQHFNTCDSMGKLTLNILLSFAQFERELGAERVRDKIAASKKKGMWTGGPVPLGYDSKNKKLVINKEEAEIIRFLKNLSKIDEFRSIIDLTHFTFIELHGGGNIDLWIKANYLSGTNIKCLYFRDRDTSTTPPSVVHPQKVIITSKREIENYIPISSIEEKFDVTFTPYEIEHWNDMDVANSLYNKGIRFGNDQKHSENVIKQILQGQNIWNQIILSPENRSEIQDWFQQMKDFFEDAGW